MRVSIVIPVIRPEKAMRCIKMATENAGIQQEDFEVLTAHDWQRLGAPKMVKALTAIAEFENVCFIGEDTLPQKNWLKEAINTMRLFEMEWGLVGLNDQTGRNDLATHWLASKRLLGYLGEEFFHTGYWHCCCDVELTERANLMGRFKYSEKSVVLHDHPLLASEKAADKDYERVYSDEYLSHDRNLLKLRRERNWQ